MTSLARSILAQTRNALVQAAKLRPFAGLQAPRFLRSPPALHASQASAALV